MLKKCHIKAWLTLISQSLHALEVLVNKVQNFKDLICQISWGAVVYGSWIYYYLCNQCLSPLMLWAQISIRARCTTLCEVCQWITTGLWFSPSPPVSSTNETDRHDITEILLKVALNTINQTNKHLKLKLAMFSISKIQFV